MPADPLVDIAVFARAPIAGHAKTRLIPRLGAAGAAALQRELTERALARACAVPGGRVVLWTTADDESMTRAARSAGAILRSQHGADLGERMAHAFEQTLGDGRPMLLIGTDCPAQTTDDLRLAVDALRTAEAVVQPAEDGGYVLIGMTRFRAELFDAIPWGSGSVLATTRARAAASGIRLAELPMSWDIDRPADLERAVALGVVELPAT
jgi:hypothetical protein